MKIAAIIPARYQSTRLPGKPLLLIKGKTMIERVYRQIEKVGKFHEIIVATDDERIETEVQRFGGNVMMTSSFHQSGTERLWEVVMKKNFDAAINIQGDEPLIPIKLVSDLYDRLEASTCDVVTAAYFNKNEDDFHSPNNVKVVFGNNARALYFSRSSIPFTRDGNFGGFFQHIGIYGYKREALERFVQLQAGPLEKNEKLEQLRFLENNLSIEVISSDQISHGVDVPGDIKKIEEILNSRELENE